ncbi:Kunitz family trypsin and protease inhibitor protein [Striga hermonthica]|uniref:Kunitz family trypsin and protease inhibitor protein n=1 Tax=Striga hermonthica TaxID=68872 RepID=A0A9N7RRN2_STRHE|nr:Kunitz family trypsin and protease inhibitor protein [Striga hermonthica]
MDNRIAWQQDWAVPGTRAVCMIDLAVLTLGQHNKEDLGQQGHESIFRLRHAPRSLTPRDKSCSRESNTASGPPEKAPPRAPILDTSGQELLTGVQYRIRSPFWGAGEGDVNVDRNSSCPLDLVLARRIFFGPGLPVTFHLPHESVAGRPVRTLTEVSIQFSTASTDTACNDGGVWTVRFQAILRGFGVTTGGSLGAANSLFTIEPAGRDHRIVYCPRIDSPGVCGALTTSFQRRLSVALSEEEGSLHVVFERVEADDIAMIKMSTDN